MWESFPEIGLLGQSGVQAGSQQVRAHSTLANLKKIFIKGLFNTNVWAGSRPTIRTSVASENNSSEGYYHCGLEVERERPKLGIRKERGAQIILTVFLLLSWGSPLADSHRSHRIRQLMAVPMQDRTPGNSKRWGRWRLVCRGRQKRPGPKWPCMCCFFFFLASLNVRLLRP